MADPLSVIVRPCFEMDLQFVQLIYAHHVTTGTGSFETAPPDVREMTARWSRIAGKEWPYLVACDQKDPTRIYGFAYAAQFRDRPAYAFTFEDSVYVAPNAMGRGVGKKLLNGLLSQLDTIGAREVIAVIGDSDNLGSINLHVRMGFRRVGVLSNVGTKFGRWLDVVLMQRTLKAAADAH
ncbi:MAG TPA: GNAT family N-acetyltransferase [Caulobacterales bacterium]|nr:GNAT family N-acetyltransferase [Caulobacterales bacterium]